MAYPDVISFMKQHDILTSIAFGIMFVYAACKAVFMKEDFDDSPGR